VVEVRAKLGDRVKAGDILLVIDSPDISAAYSEFVKEASELEYATRAYELAKDLYENKALPQKDLKQAENDRIKSQAEFRRCGSQAPSRAHRLHQSAPAFLDCTFLIMADSSKSANDIRGLVRHVDAARPAVRRARAEKTTVALRAPSVSPANPFSSIDSMRLNLPALYTKLEEVGVSSMLAQRAAPVPCARPQERVPRRLGRCAVRRHRGGGAPPPS